LGKVFVHTRDLKRTAPFLCLKTKFPTLVPQYLPFSWKKSQN